MSRAEAVALVQRIMDADYASDDEVDGWLDRLDRAPEMPAWPCQRLDRLAAGAGAFG